MSKILNIELQQKVYVQLTLYAEKCMEPLQWASAQKFAYTKGNDRGSYLHAEVQYSMHSNRTSTRWHRTTSLLSKIYFSVSFDSHFENRKIV